jgi:hypothetical protein
MGLFNRSKQNENTEDNSQDTTESDSSTVNESESSHTEPSDLEPIDTHAFVEDMRRKSEEIALGVANRLAERMDGIVEPVHPPSETGTTTFFANPRAYSICNGSTKVVLFVRPFDEFFQYDTNSDLKLTSYQQSVRDTKHKKYKLSIKWFNLLIGDDGLLSWFKLTQRVVKGEYKFVKNFEFSQSKECQW